VEGGIKKEENIKKGINIMGFNPSLLSFVFFHLSNSDIVILE
jgi:hypothetical protein